MNRDHHQYRPPRPAAGDRPRGPAATGPPVRPVDAASLLRCPHGGLVRCAGADRPGAVRAGGAALATAADTVTVSGCPHTVDGRPQPCTTVRWAPPAPGDAPLLVDGVPALLGTAGARCLSDGLVPQGAPVAVPDSGPEVECR